MSIVTDEMIEAGCAAYRRSHHGEPMPGDIEAIYLAMQMLNVRPCPNCKSKECAGTTPARNDDVEHRKELRAVLADCSEFLADIDSELADRCEAMLSQVVADDHDNGTIAAMGDGRQG